MKVYLYTLHLIDHPQVQHRLAIPGNAFRTFRDFNPFDIKRSAGVGLRVFLPMFGILGFDYGLGFDKDASGSSNIFKTFGDFNIILGFEPE